jgi:CRISPR-associated DxTHG motif protein
MKKAIITVLGTVGSKYDSKLEKLVLDIDTIKSEYYISSKSKGKKFVNTLPFLIDAYSNEYDIVPIYTNVAKDIQTQVLEKLENLGQYNSIFKEDYKIVNENDFEKVLMQINSILNQYDEIIVDVSHGFRHLPILMTIDLIMQNIKNNKKIDKILFAQEEIKPDKFKKIEGKYKIVDLKDYLDLSNLAFIITNFKDNYTISSNINISNQKYKPLITCMRSFSRDILALSMHNLFHHTLPNLIKEISKIEDDFLLKSDLLDLKEHLTTFVFSNKKQYELYFEASKELMKKDYLLQSVNLLHEAKLTYLKSAIKSKNSFNYSIIQKIEDKIKTNPTKDVNRYKLLSDLQYIYCNTNIKKLNIIDSDDAIKIKNSLIENRQFIRFLFDDLRNSLAHANSEEERDDVKADVARSVQQFEQMCMKNNILDLKKNRNYQITTENRQEKSNKKSKTKKVPTNKHGFKIE